MESERQGVRRRKDREGSRHCLESARDGEKEASICPELIPRGPSLQNCGAHVGGAGAGRGGLTRGRARPAAAAPALQQRPQRQILFLRRLALQSWGAVGSVDPALLPLPPETAPSFRTAFRRRRRPPILLLRAAPWTTRRHPLPAAWAPCQGASWAGSEQQS